jgi:amino acid adenylation domain-containing protein
VNHSSTTPGRPGGITGPTAGDASLPDLLSHQVRTRPDAIAVVCGSERLTFRELAERSERCARRLRQLGVSADQCVGLLAESSTDVIVGAWAILLAGGAYLPLAPEYPEIRLRHMIAESELTVILAQESGAQRAADLAPPGTRIVTLADTHTDTHTEAYGTERPGHRDLAYVIYTSGSSGTPKGVMIEHRSIVSQLRWLHDVHRIDESRIVLHKTSISFDAAQWEILAPACGSTVVVGAPGVHRDPDGLVDTIVANGVTTLQCVPTLLQALVDGGRLDECTTLTQVFSGGEALAGTLAERFADALPHAGLVNLYGPTECTINTSGFAVDRPAVARGPLTVPIGWPVHRTRYYILDGAGNAVSAGEVGELYISGVQVARGYLRQPELTAASFVANPFAGPSSSDQDDHGTMYRTGDLASWNSDGTVQFAGRADRQVKVNGFRIELDEIRLAIEAHDWIRHAAITVRSDDRTGFANLVAFIELDEKEAVLMDQGNHGAHHQKN